MIIWKFFTVSKVTVIINRFLQYHQHQYVVWLLAECGYWQDLLVQLDYLEFSLPRQISPITKVYSQIRVPSMLNLIIYLIRIDLIIYIWL